MGTKYKTLLILSIIQISGAAALSQTYVTPVRSDITPATPQSEAIMAAQAPQPDLLTGAASLSVPIYDVNVDNVSVPISLQYQSNGIKVLDDPAPLGYGWSLMPALRITRTILGRPDELFPFSGDPQMCTDPNAMCYMSVASTVAHSIQNTDRYDSEHDIFNIALPGKSLTRVSIAENDTIRFAGACDDEYRIETNDNLTEIIVTDPSGTRYCYGGGTYEQNCSNDSTNLRTAWPLYKIELDNGRTINLTWSLSQHPIAARQWIGGYSFRDSWSLSGSNPDYESEIDNYANAVLSRNSETTDFLRLDKITFLGGNISFIYTPVANVGPMLTSIEVSTTDSVIKTFSLTYADNNYTLLTGIDGGEGQTYSFNYNTAYGTNPFATWTGRHAQDWWGYYNAKSNMSLTPKIRVKTYPITANTEGLYTSEIGEADRSVDSVAMQALMLKRVTWPTGGTSEFEYEVHKFAPTKQDCDGQVHPAYDLSLSYGGGLRVKQITTSDGNTANDMIVRYEYPLANVRAVPSMSTFVESYNVVFVTQEYPNNIIQMRLVNIMPVSDYMRYDTGVTPLWYGHVTTKWAEGKTISYFEDIMGTISFETPPAVGYGYRIPAHMTHVFDGAPAMTKQEVYKSHNGAYLPVETTEYSYLPVLDSVNLASYHVKRDLVYLSPPDENNGPDLCDGYIIHSTLSQPIRTFLIENAYSSYLYNILPYTKSLVSKTHILHTETGDITTTEQYQYKYGTGLPVKLTTSSSEGKTSTVTVEYPDKTKGGTEAAMVSSNAVGIPLRENISHGTAVTAVRAEYVGIGTGGFRQRQTAVTYGNATSSVVSPVCEYDLLGHIVCVTDADSIRTGWTWDARGMYPVRKNQGGIETAFQYRDLVGVSQITQPYGAVSTYAYDSMNRLSQWGISGLGTMQKFDYSFAADANSITTTTWFDDQHTIVAAERYDNLGRKTSTENITTGLKQYYRYDAMGRCFASSLPSVETPASDYDYAGSVYEASPRGVVVSTVKNGELWHTGNKTVRIRTVANTATGALSAPLYAVGAGGATRSGNYGAGQLVIEETTDENGHVVRKYTNKSGLVVLTEEGDGVADMLRTRYIYDDYGRLRYILPPSFADGDFLTADDDFVKNCYELGYDGRGNLTSKRVPGATRAHRWVYSDGGRLVAEQTPSMNSYEWFCYFYDRTGRLVYTSLSGLMDEEVEWLRQDFSIAGYSGNPLYAGYDLSPEPRVPVDNPFAAAYYDNYSFLTMSNVTGMPQITDSRPGLQTGAYDSVCGYSAIEYDDWGRVVANHQNTAKGLLTSRSQLNRSGAAVQSSQQLAVSAGRTYNMVTDFNFDDGGRIKSWSVTLDNKKAGAELTYGPMGNIATEAFANNVRRAYTYDCHGWIEGITTSIPAVVPVLPELPGLQGAVSNDFYRSATTGIGTADTFEPTPVTEDYTERVMYATGRHPRYDGTASAHVATAGGRYDYLFDCHDRLTKAIYTAEDGISALGGDVDFTENFSAEYTYNAVGVPLTVKRYGVQRIDNSSGTATEQFGILDNLSYSYDGMLLSSVLAYGSADGEDYYGRPGFPTSYEGGPAEYGWNAAGLLNKDSSRGITGISYNWNGQPTKIDFTDKGYMSYTYTAAGTLTGVATYAVLGGKRATKVSERRYCGDFVFEGDSLLYANFGGGYFDGAGQPHYRHADFQGNITMVTDCRGQVEQHTGYYPYGEPWREPTGQPYLYGGKERMRDHALNEYDFGPRRLNSALALWTAPDPKASDYAGINPYSYCAGNPIKFIDPSGQDLIITGELAKKALEQLQQATPGITLSMEDGNVSYKVVNEQKVNAGSKKIMETIDNKKITTNIQTTNAECLKDGAPFVCGAYMGNTYIKVGNEEYVSAKQVINPSVIEKAEAYSIAPGMLTLHEVTEAYEGGLIALEEGASSPQEGAEGSTYERAHDRATPQSVNIYEEFFDKNGDIIKNEKDKEKATNAKWFIMPLGWRIDIQKYN